MKTLLLVRHAKSDWPENVEDFDRPLTDFGKSDAFRMARFLRSSNIDIDCFITSPALRALSTCEIFSNVFDKSFSKENSLYNPREESFEKLVYGLDNNITSVAFFSHNNGISNFANCLTDEIINLPTCGIAAYEIDCADWSDFEISKKRFLFFYSPKTNLL